VDPALVVVAVVELDGGQRVGQFRHRADEGWLVVVGGVGPYVHRGEQPQAPGGPAGLAEVAEVGEGTVEAVQDAGYAGVGGLGEEGQELIVHPLRGCGGRIRRRGGEHSAQGGGSGEEAMAVQGVHMLQVALTVGQSRGGWGGKQGPQARKGPRGARPRGARAQRRQGAGCGLCRTCGSAAWPPQVSVGTGPGYSP
jgi:hypothetical protein